MNSKTEKIDLNSKEVQELQNNEIFIHSREALCIHHNFKIVAANKPYIELFGYDSLEQIVGNSVLMFIDKSEHENFQAIAKARRVDRNAFLDYFTVGIKREGSQFDMEVKASFFEKNGIEFSITTIRDITERVNQERELKANEHRFRTIVENINPIIFMFDNNGEIVLSEGKMLETLGLKPGEVVGMNAFEMYKDFPDIIDEFNHTLKGEFRKGVNKLGDEYFEYFYAPSIDADGEISGLIGMATNVTERIRSEKELKLSEEKFRTIVENSTPIVFMLDEVGNFVLSEGKMLSSLGLKPGEVVGMNVFEMYKDFPQIIQNIQDAFAGNVVEDIVKVGELYFEAFYSPKRDENGNIDGIIAMASDVTNRYKHEQELKLSEERLRLTALASNSGHFDWLLGDKNLHWDKQMDNLFGVYSNAGKEYNRVKHFHEVLYDEDREDVYGIFMSSIDSNNQKNLFDTEFRISLENDEIRHIRAYALMFRNENGDVYRIIGTCRDITKRKEAIEYVKQSEESYKGIFDNSTDAIYILNEKWEFISVNEGAVKMYGYDRDFFVGKTPEVLSADNRNDMQATVNSMQIAFDGSPQQIEFWGKRSNGEEFPKLVRMAAGEYFGRKVLIAFALDITEVKAAEENLKRKQKQLEESNRQLINALEEAKKSKELKEALDKLQEAQEQLVQHEKMATIGILTAGMAHEINNPLNFVQGGIIGIKDHCEGMKEAHEISPYIDMIENGIDRASSIVNSMNRFNRKSGRDNEVVDINLVLDNCLNLLRNKLKHKVSIEKNYDNYKCIVIGNEGKLHQVFQNIIQNAEQAISESGIIKLTTIKSQDKVTVKIEDTGAGISADNLKKITTPFFTTKDPGMGIGLGMSISYKIIEEHKGSIKYESKEGIGTKVVVEFAVKKD